MLVFLDENVDRLGIGFVIVNPVGRESGRLGDFSGFGKHGGKSYDHFGAEDVFDVLDVGLTGHIVCYGDEGVTLLSDDFEGFSDISFDYLVDGI